MRQDVLFKIVFKDNDYSKILKGYYVTEDEHTYTFKGNFDNREIVLGKRFIVKISPVGGSQ